MSVQLLESYLNSFWPLPETVLNEFTAAFEEFDFPAHHFLLREGRICNHVYFLTQGAVRSFYRKDDKEVNIWFAFEGEMFSSFNSFSLRQPGRDNIQLLEDSLLLGIPYDRLQKLIDRHPEIGQLQGQILKMLCLEFENRLYNLLFQSAKERYEVLLHRYPHILQRVSLGHIANHLGVSQETLSRIRSGK
jgi:CRP-like cAMP-binding protein